MTDEEIGILNELFRHGHLDRSELTRLIPSLPRGMPGHYVLKGLEDQGLIKSRLPTRDTAARVYQIEEKGKEVWEEARAFGCFDHWPTATSA